MTASSAVVLGNLAYLIGAVVLATLGGLIVWWHHRQPRSVHANVESFHRGLQALAPASNQSGIRPAASGGLRIQPQPDPQASIEPTTPGELVRRVHSDSAEAETTGELPLQTNGIGWHDAPGREPAAEVDALATGLVDPAPDGGLDPPWANGTLGPRPPVGLPWANGTLDPPPPVGLPWANGTLGPPPPPVGLPWANGTLDPPPVGLPWANGTLGPPPVVAPPANGTIPRPPPGPDLTEPTLPPLIDEAASERPVSGRAGVEAG